MLEQLQHRGEDAAVGLAVLVEQLDWSEEKNINPEDTSQTKESNEHYEAGGNNEKDFGDDVSGSDLDVPGSELDDEQERIGSEDEENNYYSLGGDRHDD